jgi:hypothetical protein
VTLPATLTLLGEMQKIYFFAILASAKETPIERQVGRAGGTVIVTKSKELITNQNIVISPLLIPSIVFGRATNHPITAIIAKTAKNRSESL